MIPRLLLAAQADAAAVESVDKITAFAPRDEFPVKFSTGFRKHPQLSHTFFRRISTGKNRLPQE